MAYTQASKDMTDKVLKWFKAHSHIGSHPVIPRNELEDLAETIEEIQEEYDREIEQRDYTVGRLSKQNRYQEDNMESLKNVCGDWEKFYEQVSDLLKKARIELWQLTSEQESDRDKLAEQTKKIKHLDMLVEQKDLRVVCLEEDAATASKGLGDKTFRSKIWKHRTPPLQPRLPNSKKLLKSEISPLRN
jgi:chromosome segregation ATPase